MIERDRCPHGKHGRHIESNEDLVFETIIHTHDPMPFKTPTLVQVKVMEGTDAKRVIQWYEDNGYILTDSSAGTTKFYFFGEWFEITATDYYFVKKMALSEWEKEKHGIIQSLQTRDKYDSGEKDG